MHVTLRFLGEQPVERVPTLHAALRGACAGRAPFTLHLSELGTFGPARHARVVFSGLRGALEELAGLVGDLLEPILCTQSVPAESVRVERIGLYQSVFGPQGTEYHSMFDVELTS
jgi:2'-5' RNA ligase